MEPSSKTLLNNMNTKQALERLSAIESEAKELRDIIEAPTQRTPKGGDVWLENDGTNHIVVESEGRLSSVMLENDEFEGCLYSSDFAIASDLYKPFEKNFTYKGKFNEVYVNRAEFIADVRAAMSHKDQDGNSVLIWMDGSSDAWGRSQTRKELRQLNIITDEPQQTK